MVLQIGTSGFRMVIREIPEKRNELNLKILLPSNSYFNVT